MKLIEALRHIKANPILEFGICHNLDILAEEHNGAIAVWESLFEEFSAQWPYYSGQESYPIPSLIWGATPNEIYNCCQHNDTLWDGNYGILRRDLLSFLIAYLESEDGFPPEWHNQYIVNLLGDLE